MRAFTSNLFERLCQFWTWTSPGDWGWYDIVNTGRDVYICLIVMMIVAMWKQIVAHNLSSCSPLLSTNKTLWGRPCANLDRAIHFVVYINAKDKILSLKCSLLILFILGNRFPSFVLRGTQAVPGVVPGREAVRDDRPTTASSAFSLFIRNSWARWHTASTEEHTSAQQCA